MNRVDGRRVRTYHEPLPRGRGERAYWLRAPRGWLALLGSQSTSRVVSAGLRRTSRESLHKRVHLHLVGVARTSFGELRLGDVALRLGDLHLELRDASLVCVCRDGCGEFRMGGSPSLLHDGDFGLGDVVF